jgi:hypothetical protein
VLTIAALLDPAHAAREGPVVQVFGACALAGLMAAAREELGRERVAGASDSALVRELAARARAARQR